MEREFVTLLGKKRNETHMLILWKVAENDLCFYFFFLSFDSFFPSLIGRVPLKLKF